jgi:hypothetical protein
VDWAQLANKVGVHEPILSSEREFSRTVE